MSEMRVDAVLTQIQRDQAGIQILLFDGRVNQEIYFTFSSLVFFLGKEEPFCFMPVVKIKWGHCVQLRGLRGWAEHRPPMLC